MPQPTAPVAEAPDQVVELDRPTGDDIERGRVRLLHFPSADFGIAVETFDLDLRTYEQATVVSLHEDTSKNWNLGAAYDAAGDLIPETQRAKPGKHWKPSPAVLPRQEREPIRLEGRTFFAGRYPSHFGHTLLESHTRFWPDASYRRYDHFIAVPTHGKPALGGSSSLFAKLMRLNAIPFERFTVPQEGQPVLCERLDVSTPPFQVAHSADPRFLVPFDRIGSRVEKRRYNGDLSNFPSRIYLSRSRLKVKPRSADKRNAENEPEAEAFFERNGFTVIHPQELPLHEQVALARKADVIAGCDGSALHLGVFSRPGAKILALDTRVVANQFLINQARGLDAVHVWAAQGDVESRMAVWTLDLERVGEGLDLLVGADS